MACIGDSATTVVGIRTIPIDQQMIGPPVFFHVIVDYPTFDVLQTHLAAIGFVHPIPPGRHLGGKLAN
jgi:hypothetical protein